MLRAHRRLVRFNVTVARCLIDPSTIGFSTLWTAAGIVVGFSVTAIVFRIGRESQKRDESLLYWLPPADYVLLTSMAVALLGVFVLPILGASLGFALYSLGLSMTLLAAYPFVLAGHYEILLPRAARLHDQQYPREAVAEPRRARQDPLHPDNNASEPGRFPFQERVLLGIAAGLAILYVALAVVLEAR